MTNKITIYLTFQADLINFGRLFTSINLILNNMNKQDLINAIAKDAKVTKATAKKSLDAIIKVTTKSLAKGQKVALVGFGTFSVYQKKARKGRNPQTGKEIRIPAKKVVKFRFSKGNKL
jgi:DNA-binding protein HU-beta